MYWQCELIFNERLQFHAVYISIVPDSRCICYSRFKNIFAWHTSNFNWKRERYLNIVLAAKFSIIHKHFSQLPLNSVNFRSIDIWVIYLSILSQKGAKKRSISLDTFFRVRAINVSQHPGVVSVISSSSSNERNALTGFILPRRSLRASERGKKKKDKWDFHASFFCSLLN